MAKTEYEAVSDGTYTLAETDNDNQFVFFREDDGVLGDVGNLPVEMYHYLWTDRMMKSMVEDEGSPSIFAANIKSEISDDGKAIRLTIEEVPVLKVTLDSEPQKKPGLFQRLKEKFFG